MFAGIFCLQAQQQGFQRRTVPERVKMTMDRISDSLKLTTAQQADADSAFTQYYTAMEKIRASLPEGTRPERSDFEKIITERDAKLKIIFNEQQYNMFKNQLEPNMRRPRGDRPQGNN